MMIIATRTATNWIPISMVLMTFSSFSVGGALVSMYPAILGSAPPSNNVVTWATFPKNPATAT